MKEILQYAINNIQSVIDKFPENIPVKQKEKDLLIALRAWIRETKEILLDENAQDAEIAYKYNSLDELENILPTLRKETQSKMRRIEQYWGLSSKEEPYNVEVTVPSQLADRLKVAFHLIHEREKLSREMAAAKMQIIKIQAEAEAKTQAEIVKIKAEKVAEVEAFAKKLEEAAAANATLREELANATRANATLHEELANATRANASRLNESRRHGHVRSPSGGALDPRVPIIPPELSSSSGISQIKTPQEKEAEKLQKLIIPNRLRLIQTLFNLNKSVANGDAHRIIELIIMKLALTSQFIILDKKVIEPEFNALTAAFSHDAKVKEVLELISNHMESQAENEAQFKAQRDTLQGFINKDPMVQKGTTVYVQAFKVLRMLCLGNVLPDNNDLRDRLNKIGTDLRNHNAANKDNPQLEALKLIELVNDQLNKLTQALNPVPVPAARP